MQILWKIIHKETQCREILFPALQVRGTFGVKQEIQQQEEQAKNI